MNIIKVGESFPGGKGHIENCHFILDNGGASLVVYFHSPTNAEIEQFRENHRFELRFVVLNGVIFILAKIGNLNWMDMPYKPNKDLTIFPEIEEGGGLSLSLMLVDTATGNLKHFRLIGMATKFSRRLIQAIQEQGNDDFDRIKYQQRIDDVYRKYPTTALVKLASDYFKIKGD